MTDQVQHSNHAPETGELSPPRPLLCTTMLTGAWRTRTAAMAGGGTFARSGRDGDRTARPRARDGLAGRLRPTSSTRFKRRVVNIAVESGCRERRRRRYVGLPCQQDAPSATSSDAHAAANDSTGGPPDRWQPEGDAEGHAARVPASSSTPAANRHNNHVVEAPTNRRDQWHRWHQPSTPR